MDRSERIEHITETIQNAIIRLSQEYNIKVAEMVGVLEIIKLNIVEDSKDE